MSSRSAWKVLREMLRLDEVGLDPVGGPGVPGEEEPRQDGMAGSGMALKPRPDVGLASGNNQQAAPASGLATAPNSPTGLSSNAGNDKDPTQPTDKDQPGTGMTPAWLDLVYGRGKEY